MYRKQNTAQILGQLLILTHSLTHDDRLATSPKRINDFDVRLISRPVCVLYATVAPKLYLPLLFPFQ